MNPIMAHLVDAGASRSLAILEESYVYTFKGNHYLQLRFPISCRMNCHYTLQSPASTDSRQCPGFNFICRPAFLLRCRWIKLRPSGVPKYLQGPWDSTGPLVGALTEEVDIWSP